MGAAVVTSGVSFNLNFFLVFLNVKINILNKKQQNQNIGFAWEHKYFLAQVLYFAFLTFQAFLSLSWENDPKI